MRNTCEIHSVPIFPHLWHRHRAHMHGRHVMCSGKTLGKTRYGMEYGERLRIPYVSQRRWAGSRTFESTIVPLEVLWVFPICLELLQLLLSHTDKHGGRPPTHIDCEAQCIVLLEGER
jgi:hypothetical protein